MSTAKLLPLLLLLLAVAVAAAATATPIQAVVEGIVYCQSCSCRGSWSLRDSKPLPAAKISVTCRDAKNRPNFYKVAPTNSDGYFYCPMDAVNATDYYKGDPVEACYVRLLSSADGKCNHLTNINYGLTGAKLKKEDKTKKGLGYDTVIYAVKSLAFRPASCTPTHRYQ
ncbi:Non-classical arabinogalactan protein 31 [Ananas comosus]|uniref:Non-classical arabinogalactan protein 31 n=1 Tax=Ananas comosus TaxID=4615 RepID=A0A199ULS4_ANACO|nr:Non-classical arabinogalactan protein 31 [Ananas comosus]